MNSQTFARQISSLVHTAASSLSLSLSFFFFLVGKLLSMFYFLLYLQLS